MQFSTVVLALAAAGAASAQAVTKIITPTGSAPPGCTASYDGDFMITVVKPNAKREIQKRDSCPGEGTLVISLENGILKDAKDRQGYIASNYQFQFDGPPQAGAIYTAGFSVCGNSSIALGSTTVFYQCQSGGFYNLYNKDWADQCEPVAIDVVPCGGSSLPSPGPSAGSSASSASAPTGSGSGSGSGSAPSPATQITDGQPQAGSATPIPVSEFTDGQPQVPSALVSQITDGQPQAPSAAPAPSVAHGEGAAFGVAQQVVLAAAGLAGAALL